MSTRAHPLLRTAPLALSAALLVSCTGAPPPQWSFGPASTPGAASSEAPATPAPTSAPTAEPATPSPEPATPSPEPATPSPEPAASNAATATLAEFKIDLAPTTLLAGTDTFTVVNDGTIGHEFVVRKTDIAPDALPHKADGTVDEAAPELEDIGEIEIPDAGATETLTLDLTPGHYVFFCNIPGHYVGGMHGGFTVIDPNATASDATATLSEFKIDLEPSALTAGTNTFTVANAGTIGHEFVVRRTDLADDALPQKADGTVDEAAPELEDVGEIEIPDAGATDTLTLDLTPGNYVFFCNIPGHYVGGMHGSFTVDAPSG